MAIIDDIKGVPIVVSGPSGVGKGTIVKKMLEQTSRVKASVSMTTRPLRPGEKDGLHYFFVTEERFMAAIDHYELIEWAQVYGNFYGTPREMLEYDLANGTDVILEIDVQGAASAHTIYPEAVLVYVVPPSLEELNLRLYAREHVKVDKLDQPARDLKIIVETERLKTKRYKPVLLETGVLKET